MRAERQKIKLLQDGEADEKGQSTEVLLKNIQAFQRLWICRSNGRE